MTLSPLHVGEHHQNFADHIHSIRWRPKGCLASRISGRKVLLTFDVILYVEDHHQHHHTIRGLASPILSLLLQKNKSSEATLANPISKGRLDVSISNVSYFGIQQLVTIPYNNFHSLYERNRIQYCKYIGQRSSLPSLGINSAFPSSLGH